MRQRCLMNWAMICAISMFYLSCPILSYANDQINHLSSSKFPPHISNELIIQLKPGINIALPAIKNSGTFTGIPPLDSLNSAHDLKAINPLLSPLTEKASDLLVSPLAQAYVFKFSKSADVTSFIDRYQALPIVENVEVNQIFHSHNAKTIKPVAIDQRQLTNAASLIKPKRQVIIGIIDTGIDWQKKHLFSSLWKNQAEKSDGTDNDANGFADDVWGWNFVDPELMQQAGLQWNKIPADNCGHGTRIAEICIQISKYHAGKNDHNPNLLMILKAGFATGDGSIIFTTAATSRAIIYAANHGANIITITWASAFPSRILRHAIDYAIGKGCLVIASAGDKNSQRPSYPAAWDNVCAIAAIDSTNKKLNSSNYGEWIDIAAPYVLQKSDSPPAKVSATSMATAHVAAFAALTASSEGNFHADDLRRRIIWSSDNIHKNNPDYIGQLGAGKINLKRALLSEFQSNVIIQNCIALQDNQTLSTGEIIPFAVHVRNLASPAKNVEIKITSDDPIVDFLNSSLTVPHLNYKQSYSNESEPFKIIVKQPITNEYRIQLSASIITENGFSSNQKFTLSVGKSSPKNLTLIHNAPVTLYWSEEDKFSGYHIYRKQGDQQSFVRISEIPMQSTSFIDDAADANHLYHYFITGIDQLNCESSASNIVSLKVPQQSQFISGSMNESSERLRISSVFPPSDTALTRGDSLTFHCLLDTMAVGQLKYSWLLNEKLLDQAHESSFILKADLFQHPKNSLKVVISNTSTVLSFQWNIEFVQKLTTVSFFPASDTTILVSDTLKLGFKSYQRDRSKQSFKWLINGIHDSTATEDYYILKPNFVASGADTIMLQYDSADTSITHQWLITILDRVRLPRIVSFHPSQDTTIIRGDTLKLLVNAGNKDLDSLSFQWTVNGKIDSTASDAFYFYSAKNKHTKSDTIVVKISNQDSSLQNAWIIDYLKRNNTIPRIISCTPSIDANLSKMDSIRFQISCYDPDQDSLKFAWYLNSRIDTTAHDSIYLYPGNHASRFNDTLRVAISDADTTIKIEWILRAGFGSRIDSSLNTVLRWFPESDSIVTSGDSVIFSVRFAMDSSQFQWSINSIMDSTQNDSVFIYRISNESLLTDTIRVLVFTPDTMVSRQWRLYYSNPRETSSKIAVAFTPSDESINYFTSDSLKFSVHVINGQFSDMKFIWQINQTPDTTFQDTTFSYAPNYLITELDTVKITIVYKDTTLSHEWIVRKNNLTALPAPILLFPTKGDHITEENFLWWQNDSSFARLDSAGQFRFVVQVAKDTSFKQIISTDTCQALKIELKKLSGFHHISAGKPLYWRVKRIKSSFSISEFKKCNMPFFYYPLFAKLENFYAEKTEEGYINLFWSTSYDKNCAGFDVHRSESEDDTFVKINDKLITGNTSFAFQDQAAEAGTTYYYKLEEVCFNNRKKFHKAIMVTTPKPEKYFLYQNFPNPFNSTTSFKYEIPIRALVKIEVYNVLGRKIKTLVNEEKEEGFYTVYWDGIDDQDRSVVSGIYFYHMSANKFNMTHKMIVVR